MLLLVLSLSLSHSLTHALSHTQIECMVASEIMQRYRKLQFEKGESEAPLSIKFAGKDIQSMCKIMHVVKCIKCIREMRCFLTWYNLAVCVRAQ